MGMRLALEFQIQAKRVRFVLTALFPWMAAKQQHANEVDNKYCTVDDEQSAWFGTTPDGPDGP